MYVCANFQTCLSRNSYDGLIRLVYVHDDGESDSYVIINGDGDDSHDGDGGDDGDG